MSEAAAAAGFSRLFSDDRLTRRAVGGDERAFAAIFRRYHQSLYRFCLAIVGNPEDAQDALQNTMMKVLRALPGEERKIELKPWLYRIAHNESIDLLRRRRETNQLDVEQVAPGYGLAEDAATRERLRRLLVDLRELPERQREVLVMREMAGLDFDEIAVALETSGAVARQTLYEARQSLRQMEEGREMSCETVTRALSDGDGRVTRRRDVRAHLRSCASCRGFRDEIKSRQHDLAVLSPLPAMAAAGMLQGLLGGGSQAATGGGLAAVLGGGAAKTIGASAAAKGMATAAVVAAVGVTAADRGGVIHLGLPGEERAKSGPATPGDAGHQHKSAHPASQVGVGSGNPASPGQRSSNSAAGKTAPGAAASDPTGALGANGHQGAPHQGAPHEVDPPAGSKAQGPPVEHASGREHEKQHPVEAAGGGEVAEEHKPELVEPKGGSGGADTVKPAKPPKTAPSNTPAPPLPPSKEPSENPSPLISPEPPSKAPPQSKAGESATPAPASTPGGGAENPGKGTEKRP